MQISIHRQVGDAWRGLLVAHRDDDWYVFTILDNKASTGNDWYDHAVPQSDALVALAVEQLALKPLPAA